MTTQELRELDAYIAEHLFGFKWGHFGFVKNGLPDFEREPIYLLPPSRFDGSTHSGHGREFPRDKVDGWKYRGGNNLVPLYTTDPAAAMQVLEKCAEKVAILDFITLAKGPDGWLVASCLAQAEAETLPLTICKFARELFKSALMP